MLIVTRISGRRRRNNIIQNGPPSRCSGKAERAVIEFLCAEGETPVNMHKRMEKMYGASCIDINTVKRWVVQFNQGERELRDRPRSGRPATAVTEENKERVDALIKDDRRIRRQQLCDIVGIGHSGMDVTIEGLGYRKICALGASNADGGA